MYTNSVFTVLLGQSPYLTELTVVRIAKESQVRMIGTSRPADRSLTPEAPRAGEYHLVIPLTVWSYPKFAQTYPPPIQSSACFQIQEAE